MQICGYIYFYSTISRGIIIWTNSTDSAKMFKMQRSSTRIITGSKNWDSCRHLFKNTTISLTIHIITPIIFGRQQKHVQFTLGHP